MRGEIGRIISIGERNEAIGRTYKFGNISSEILSGLTGVFFSEVLK
jgi:hypothetical protein